MRVIACCVLVVACVVLAEDYDVVPETLMEELSDSSVPEDTTITRECFQKSCTEEGCRLSKFDCPKPAAPWAVFISKHDKKKKLVHTTTVKKHAPGLVDLVMHKSPVNPNKAITMPGVPAEVSPKLQAAFKKQEMLLKKITKMEKYQLKKDDMHKHSRRSWLKLRKQVSHMPYGPDKLKNEGLLLHLAKQLASQEDMERKKQDSNGKKQDGPEDRMSKLKKLSKKELIKRLMKVAATGNAQQKEEPKATPDSDKQANEAAKVLVPLLRKLLAPHSQPRQPRKTLNGLPVSHQKCYERACVKRLPDGTCGAAVISCGNKVPQQDRTPEDKKAAMGQAMHDMKHLLPLMKGASKEESELELYPTGIVEELLD